MKELVMPDFESWKKYTLDTVREVGRSIRPDGDWVPVLLMFTRRGFAPVLLRDVLTPDNKHRLPVYLKSAFAEYRPVVASIVLPSRTKFIQVTDNPTAELELDRAKSFGLADDPEAQEIVLVQISDGRKSQTFMAHLRRSENNPPTLGEWIDMDKDAECVDGRFANMLLKAYTAAGFNKYWSK